MRVLILFIFLVIGCFSFSQKLTPVQQNNVLTFLYTVRDSQTIIDTCDKYLNTNNLNPNFRADLLTLKGLALSRIPLDGMESCDSLRDIKDSLFEEAIEICTDCKIMYLKKKHSKYFCHKTSTRIGQYEDSILKMYGYKHDFLAPVASPQYFYGNNDWIGLEVSLFNYLQPYFRVKDSCKGRFITYYDANMVAASFLSLGYRKNISRQKGWGMNLSILSLSAHWINLRPLNLSYLNNGSEGTLGYSPELGIQFWHFHLNAGYNLAFKKSMRSYEKLYFTAKFDIPILWF